MEHCLKEPKSALTSGNTAQSGVAEHAVEQMHEINWKEAEVVDSHPYFRQRCVLKAWHIHTEHQTMNRDEGLLPSEYNPLIRQLRPAAVTIIIMRVCICEPYRTKESKDLCNFSLRC